MMFAYFRFPAFYLLENLRVLSCLRRAEERRRTESTEDQTSPARRTTADDCIMSLASSAAAAAPVPGVLIRQSPSTLRPSFTARLLPSGAARPLQATSASRRLPASAVRAQSAADPGQEPLLGSFLPKSSRACWIAADCAASVGRFLRVLA